MLPSYINDLFFMDSIISLCILKKNDVKIQNRFYHNDLRAYTAYVPFKSESTHSYPFLNRELAKQLADKGIIVFEDVKDVIMKSKSKIPFIFTNAVTTKNHIKRYQGLYLWESHPKSFNH
jgi:hypothetical protein